MLDGVAWLLRSGAAWRDMPECFGSWRTVYHRFRVWRNRGIFDQACVPLRFLLSGGQTSDISYTQPLLDDVCIPVGKRGRPRKRCRWLLADKGYYIDALRRFCDRYRIQPVIPLRTMKRKPKPGLSRLFDRPKYRQCNVIERMFGWLKENPRIVTRFDELEKVMA